MKRRIVISALMLAWLVTGAFSAPAPAAGAPLIRFETVDYTETSSALCGYPIKVHTTGFYIYHDFMEGDTITRSIVNASVRMTYTNVNNGKTLWTPSANVTFNVVADSTRTITTRGMVWHIVAPKMGLVTADVGNIEWKYKLDTSGRIVSGGAPTFSKGQQNNNFSTILCQILK